MTSQAPDESGAWTKTKEVMIIMTCPLLNKECIGNDCKLWTSTETIDANCILFEIVGTLYQIKARLVFIDDAVGRLASPPE